MENAPLRKLRVKSGKQLEGTIQVPGDKSISHRALILGALAEGTSNIRHFLPAGDTLATLACIEAMGVTMERHDDTTLTIHGVGLGGLEQPSHPLDCKNAGTAMRLLAGVLAGQPFPSVLDGSPQLRRRPMRRITGPLRQMGANIEEDDGGAPLYISGSFLHNITYRMPIASGQVKSCLLLASLYADGPTTIIEPGPARDHTERMLQAMGAEIEIDHNRVTIAPPAQLKPLNMTVPGDISSAAFVLMAGAFCTSTRLQIWGVGVNPTRTGILDALILMGVRVIEENPREEGGEPVADLIIEPRPLNGATIAGDLVVRMIDEFPILMVAATQAKGKTEVRDAKELRVKETDRIAVMAAELRKLGATIQEQEDGFIIRGRQILRGATVDGHDDHRVAMSLVVAALCAQGETIIENADCIDDSFPGFIETLQELGADVH